MSTYAIAYRNRSLGYLGTADSARTAYTYYWRAFRNLPTRSDLFPYFSAEWKFLKNSFAPSTQIVALLNAYSTFLIAHPASANS